VEATSTALLPDQALTEDTRLEAQLTCKGCGNQYLSPPSSLRDYACPRCGRLLPRAAGLAVRGRWKRALPGFGPQLRYFLLLIGLFGAVALGVRGGLSGPRAAASAQEPGFRRSLAIRLTPSEERNYVFRLRQLEKDLKRDPTDFDVLRRLGQLHLRLAACQVSGRSSHLRRARYYLRLAGDVPKSAREEQIIRSLIEAANSPNPAVDLLGVPADFGPPQRIEEEVVRYRIGWLEDQVGQDPQSSRMLCRLADNYSLLYRILREGGRRRLGRWPGASGVSDPDEARRLAEHDYERALQSATTIEARCKALYGVAQLYRAVEEPERAASALRALLELQPNHWFAALEMARLSRERGESKEASRYESLAARWRTPGWL
jgi:tetratricopeptide (TPR) repeat protein